MSGKVENIGYRGQHGHRASLCKGCGDRIQWGQMFGKRHPFNLDGSSHFDTCLQADGFRKGHGPSLRTLGDHDTFYRERWRAENYSGVREFDREGLVQADVPPDIAVRLSHALVGIGGPLYTAGFPAGFIQQCFQSAGVRGERVVAVRSDNLILFRLRDYFGETDFRPYCISEVFVV